MRTDDLEAPNLPLSWRLLAANNRDVARSAAPYADLTTCLDAVADLQSHIDDAVAVAARSGRADWSWRLRLDGRDVAVSSRTYQRRLQCEAACALFVALVRDATLDVFGHGEAMEPAASPDKCGTEASIAAANAEHGELESVVPEAVTTPTGWVDSIDGQAAPDEPTAPSPAPLEPVLPPPSPAQPASVDPVPIDRAPVRPPVGRPAPALPAASAPTAESHSLSRSTGPTSTTWSAAEIVPPRP